MSRQDHVAAVLGMQVANTSAWEAIASVANSDPTALDQALSSALCAGLEPRCYMAARLAWIQDGSVVNELERQLWKTAEVIAKKERWPRIRGVQYPRQLSVLAIHELRDPRRWGKTENKCRWMWCEEADWPVHRPRYEAIYGALMDWLDVAASHVAHRLKDDS